MDQSLDTIVRPWDRLDGEPVEWFRIFLTYYLPLREQRSLRNAFEFFIRAEQPSHYEHVDPNNVQWAPGHWSEIAAQWSWSKRALLYDEAQHAEFQEVFIQTALTYLQANAMNAARALVDALSNERTRVQAANSILNRAGIPETSEVLLKAGTTVTSDDMNVASDKVNEWKQRKLSG